MVGFLLMFAAGILGVVAGEDGGIAVFAVASVPGSAMVTIGLIAKGVQVGIRSARD